MKCGNCGWDNAEGAAYCVQCGASQAGTAPIAAASRFGLSAALVAAGVVVAALAIFVLYMRGEGTQPAATQASSGAGMNQATGQAPAPTDQSAAPTPPPAPLPSTADAGTGNVAAEPGNAGQAASVDASNLEQSPRVPATDVQGAASARARAPASSPRPAVSAAARAAHADRTTAGPALPAAHPAVAPVAPAAKAEPVPSAQERWSRMKDDLSRCTREDFITRVICGQRVRFRYCDGYWGKVPECPAANSFPDHGQ